MSMSKFGDFVADTRRKRGLTQAQLAKKAGLAPSTIGDIEQGTQQSTRNIDLLAKALELTPENLRQCKDTADVSAPPQLDQREIALIQKFRAISDIDQGRVEAFMSGIRPARRGPKPAARAPAPHPTARAKDRRIAAAS